VTRTLLSLGLVLLLGCPPNLDDDDDVTSPPPDGCPDEDLFVPTECNDPAYCGPATVQVGTGSGGFASLTEGEEVPIWYGSQGGYHIDITARMDKLCPIVFLVPSMHLDPGNGEDLIEIFTQTRHVQAVRIEPKVSALQDFWGIRGFVPCEYWPDDAANPDATCGDGAQGSAGHIEDFEIIFRMEAWDHNLSPKGEDRYRYATDERRIQPVCCRE
jgi:hypothetical protein